MEAASALTLQFLAWVAGEPRTYAQAMDAWRTSCPRLSIWEDALRDGLVRIERDGERGMKLARVVVTARGLALLQDAAVQPATDVRKTKVLQDVG